LSAEEGVEWLSEELSVIVDGSKLVKPSPGQSLFKYISLDSERSWGLLYGTLKHGLLVGQAAKSLNDPFELSPSIFDDLRDDEFVEMVVRKRNPFLKLTNDEHMLVPTAKARDIAEDYIRDIQSGNLIISFSERHDSPLLWAHYANNYRGACLHFLGGNMFGYRDSLFGKVQYRENRPILPLSLAYNLADKQSRSRSVRLRAAVQKLFFFEKAIDWSYEKEVRHVYSLTPNRDSVSFEQRNLLSIICGPRMAQDDKDRLRQIVSESAFTSIPILDAQVSKNSFGIFVDW